MICVEESSWRQTEALDVLLTSGSIKGNILR